MKLVTPSEQRRRRGLAPTLLAIAVAITSFASPAVAQDDIGVLYDKAISAMREKKWDVGKAALEEIIQRYGDSALEDFGPRFGGIYYSYGVCQFELKQYPEAAKSFQTCFEKFKNKGDTEAPARNPYNQISQFQWAAAEQYAGNYETALELFTKFRNSKPTPKPGSYSEAAWILSVGICNAKLGKPDIAATYIGRAFREADKLGATPRQLTHGFRVLAESWARAGAKSEASANQFLDQYGHLLTLDPYRMADSGLDKAFLQLGAQAAGAKMYTFAVRLFSLIPKTSDVVQHLKERAANYPTIPPKLQAEIDKYQAIIDTGDPLEIRTLSQIATSYDKLGNQRAGYVLYDYLATNYPKTKFRPDILYGAAAMASKAGELRATQYYGTVFLEDFPDHERRQDVAQLMLGHLFQNGAYQEAWELAVEVRVDLPDGSPERDLADFVTGGALHHLSRFEEAEP